MFLFCFPVYLFWDQRVETFVGLREQHVFDAMFRVKQPSYSKALRKLYTKQCSYAGAGKS